MTSWNIEASDKKRPKKIGKINFFSHAEKN
jgi:hypothetical protein